VVFTRLLKASETLKVYVPHAIREKFLLFKQSDFDHYPRPNLQNGVVGIALESVDGLDFMEFNP